LILVLPWCANGQALRFADASLYWLSVATGIREILTVDTADFVRYRFPDGRQFQLL
jgi:hypothetical protein